MKETIRLNDIAIENFKGWGVSLQKDSNDIIRNCDKETRQEFLEKIYGKDGLMLTSTRFTLNGGENPQHNHQKMNIQGFQDSATDVFYPKDKYQIWLLLESIRMGAKRLHIYSQSPPHWLTRSGCSSGSCDGSSNLKRENYTEFVDYIMSVLEYFRKTYKIEFDTISPTNEPTQEWFIGECNGVINSISTFGKKSGEYEGCKFTKEDQITLSKMLSERLRNRVFKTKMGISEDASIPKTIETLSEFKKNSVMDLVQVITTHSNWGSIEDRLNLKNIARGEQKDIIMSDWGIILDKGEDIVSNSKLDGGIGLAKHICNDINNLGCNEWILSSISPNLIEATNVWKNLELKKRYFIYKHFTNFINQGFSIINTKHSNNLLIATSDNKLIIVVVNDSDMNQNVEINVESVKGVNLVNTFVTDITQDLERVNEYSSFIENGIIKLNAIRNSVYTLESNIQNGQVYNCLNQDGKNLGNILLEKSFDENAAVSSCDLLYPECDYMCRSKTIESSNETKYKDYAKFTLPDISVSNFECKKGDVFIDTVNVSDKKYAEKECNKLVECHNECTLPSKNDIVEGFQSKKGKKLSRMKMCFYIILLLLVSMLIYHCIPRNKISNISDNINTLI
jgi:O-glycosyl hydrolase